MRGIVHQHHIFFFFSIKKKKQISLSQILQQISLLHTHWPLGGVDDFFMRCLWVAMRWSWGTWNSSDLVVHVPIQNSIGIMRGCERLCERAREREIVVESTSRPPIEAMPMVDHGGGTHVDEPSKFWKQKQRILISLSYTLVIGSIGWSIPLGVDNNWKC